MGNLFLVTYVLGGVTDIVEIREISFGFAAATGESMEIRNGGSSIL